MVGLRRIGRPISDGQPGFEGRGLVSYVFERKHRLRHQVSSHGFPHRDEIALILRCHSNFVPGGSPTPLRPHDSDRPPNAIAVGSEQLPLIANQAAPSAAPGGLHRSAGGFQSVKSRRSERVRPAWIRRYAYALAIDRFVGYIAQ
jgi:hypothetical protein